MIAVLTKKSKENISLVKGGMKERLLTYSTKYTKDAKVKIKIHHIIAAIDSFEE